MMTTNRFVGTLLELYSQKRKRTLKEKNPQLSTLDQVYNQSVRWQWGATDVGYLLVQSLARSTPSPLHPTFYTLHPGLKVECLQC